MAEAMALALLTKLGSAAMEKLETMAKEKFLNDYELLVAVQSEAENLKPKIEFIKAYLHDADLKQFRDDNLKSWMDSLKDIMYEADDVLDEWYTRIFIFQSEINSAPDFSRKLYSFFSSNYCSCFQPFLPFIFGNNPQLPFDHIDTARTIKSITARLEALITTMHQFKLICSPTSEDNHLHIDRETSSVVKTSGVFGREDEKKTIISWLRSESSEQQKDGPVIISIVATGGFGKTTLAQLVFSEVETEFGTKNMWWVWVSRVFDRKRVAREIIQQASGRKPDVDDSWQVLQKRLFESVRGKKLLLVLDDAWSLKQNDWDELKVILAGSKQGSRILITTRDEKVAEMMGCTRTHTLKLGKLSDGGSFSLFRQIAFSGKFQDNTAELEKIGVQLVAKCGGIPLAVKTLAGHMRSRQYTVREWRKVLNSNLWEVQVKHHEFFPALLLSYQAFPSSLKQCFMYCAVFPKGEIFKKDTMVKLWIAQGFLEPDGRQELEEIGKQYFDHLAMVSLFQDPKIDEDDGIIVSCKMHDLVHDFAQFLSGQGCCIHVSPNEVCSKQTRHMSVQYAENLPIYKAKNLRTLIILENYWMHSVPSNVFHFTYLRSLVFTLAEDIEELPSEVGRLMHLRYLDLSWSALKELPSTLCNLYNLQTLKLIGCSKLIKLPEEIGNLSNLRHAKIQDTPDLSYIPQSIGKLSQLQTLSKFIVRGAGGGCNIEDLGCFKNLKGYLELKGLNHVGSVSEAERAQMQEKELRCLCLDFECSASEDADDDAKKRMEGILEVLQPVGTLEEFEINNYPGSTFPSWMSRVRFPILVKLELWNCYNLTEFPSFGNLKNLQSLQITMLRAVKHINSVSENALPHLRDLSVSGCPNLMELPALGRLESLETIWLSHLSSIKQVGSEFLGVACHGGEEEIVFPRLRELRFYGLLEWEEWNLSLLLPNLRYLIITACPKLKTFPSALCKFQSLKYLCVHGLALVKNVGVDILGISDGNVVAPAATRDGESLSATNVILFPNLRELELVDFPEWEEEQACAEIEKTCTILPALRVLRISRCGKLKVLPHYLLSHSLRQLFLFDCPQLTGTQPCLPPLLEILELDGDVGVFSESLLLITNQDNNSNYPNLKSFRITKSPHSSLPQGLSKCILLEEMEIAYCEFLDVRLEELTCFPKLPRVAINRCPIIKAHREDWNNHLNHRQIPFKVDWI